MAGLTTRYYSLSGGLNTSYGLGTINSSTRLTESPETYNVEPYKLSGLKSQEGNRRLGQTLTDDVSFGIEYRKGRYKYMVVYTVDGNVWEYDKVTNEFKVIYTFPTATKRCSGCLFNQGVVLSNGVDDLVFYSHGRNERKAGKVDVTNGSTTVTGTDTDFGTSVNVGDYITIEDCAGRYKITEVTDSTTMKVTPTIDTSYTVHYYNFFNGADNYYCLSSEPSVGDDVYDDNEQVVSTVDYYQALSDGEGAITFQIGGNDVLGVRRHVPTGSDTFNRDKEVTVTPATLSGKVYRLTDISELNAIYVNSDDPTVSDTIRGLAIQSYQGRIWVGANNGNLYYSEVGLIHGWDVKYGAGAIPQFYNDNSGFTALGLYANYLIIHKQDFSYYLNGTSEDDSLWQLSPYTDHSCDSQQSWVSANNSYYVYSRLNGGIYPFMARTAFINHYLGQEISTKVRDDFLHIDDGRYDEIFAVYHPVKKYLMFYMPMLRDKGSNTCYIFDFVSKGWWMRRLPDSGSNIEHPQVVTCAFEYDNDVYIGTQDGRVLKEFSSLTFDGDPIEFCWKSPWFQYGDGTNYLSTREFRCKISEEYTNNFYVRNRRDGYDAYHSRNINNDKDAFEALVWSNDEGNITETVWDDFDWVEAGFLIRRFPIPDQFFTSQQIEFYGSVKNEAMCLLGFELDRVEKEEVPW